MDPFPVTRADPRATHMPTAPSISAAFDAGNIEFVQNSTTIVNTVQLKIKPDIYTELEKKQHSQWFYFRSTAEPGVITYEIVNAGEVSFPGAWPGSKVCVSTDRKIWTRVDNTSYDEAKGLLSWSHVHTHNTPSVYFAYFDPYDYERHLTFVASCAKAPGATVRSLGTTLDGREIDCVEVGTGPLHCWVNHRQHPGETQASFFAEGLLTRLLGLTSSSTDGGGGGYAPDGLAVSLRRQFTFHIVPNINPDGSIRGHLRTNACGANLNREWASTGDYVAPTLARSPEVHHSLRAMDATGVDAFVDVHGDEALPFAFIAGAEGCKVWGPRIEALQAALVASYSRANPDMQSHFGYEADEPLGANPAVCSNQIADRYDCLAVTLEMPFKDNANNLNMGTSFQGPRAAALGASLLDALAYVAPKLRGVELPTFGHAAMDAYVAPVEDGEKVKAFVAAQEAKLAGEGAAVANGSVADAEAHDGKRKRVA